MRTCPFSRLQAAPRLDLTEDIGLADHLALQRGGDGEDVPQRPGSGNRVEVSPDLFPRRLAELGQRPRHRLRRRPRRVRQALDLDPVAGRQHDRLIDPALAQAGQKARRRAVVDENPVAQVDGAGTVVETGHQQAVRQGASIRHRP